MGQIIGGRQRIYQPPFTVAACSGGDGAAANVVTTATTNGFDPGTGTGQEDVRVQVGAIVTGTGVPDGITVATFTDSTHITLNRPLPVALSSVTLTFQNVLSGIKTTATRLGWIDGCLNAREVLVRLRGGVVAAGSANTNTVTPTAVPSIHKKADGSAAATPTGLALHALVTLKCNGDADSTNLFRIAMDDAAGTANQADGMPFGAFDLSASIATAGAYGVIVEAWPVYDEPCRQSGAADLP